MNERSTSIRDRILNLVQQALDEFDKPDYRLSSIIQKVTRIARLRSDWKNLLWLSIESINLKSSTVREQVLNQLKVHFEGEEWTQINKLFFKMYREERKCDFPPDGKIPEGFDELCVLSVGEIEQLLKSIPELLKASSSSSVKARIDCSIMQYEYVRISERIGSRVHEFLSLTEEQLMEGQVLSSIFEQNRRYVDERLSEVAPDVLEKFKIVSRRLEEGDVEARSEALVTCRRILKSLASYLYPPTDEIITDSSGRERKMSKVNYKNRLWQYVSEKVKGHSAGELLLSQIEDLGNRIDSVYELTCKGTHADVSESEANQCVIQTYMTVGDILRIAEGDSGIFAKTPDILTDS